MANLVETSTFDNVTQLEITDRVIGGAGGKSNQQAQQLVNRTKWLKDAIAALDGGGGPFDLDASGGTLPAAGSGPGGAVKRKDQYRVTVAGTISGVAMQIGDTLVARIDAAAVIADYIVLQGNTDLATATILGLVKLGQDISGGSAADRTLSIAGLISIFAQLASPAFTGNPTVPDQAAGNNSGRIANTKYVDAAVGVEAAARASAVSTEATNRANTDTTLQNNINAEAAARGAADTTLQNNINALDGAQIAWNTIAAEFASGWAPAASGYEVQYRKFGGKLELRGSPTKSSAPNCAEVMFTLPAGFRPPSRVLRVPVGVSGTTGGANFIDINVNGDVTMFEMAKSVGNPMTNSGCFLDGVSVDIAH